MLGIGMLIVAVGFIALIWGVFQKVKAGRVADAPLVGTAQAAQGQGAGPKGQISAQGRVVCQQPLVSPVTGTPCLYYKLKTEAHWKSGNENKSKTIDEQKVAAQFALDDGSGPVWVDAREGGDFDTKNHNEEKSTGLLGGITGQDLVFGNYRVSTGMMSLGTKYVVREEVLPIAANLYACGKTANGSISAPGWRSLILTTKTRDELLSHATKSAKTFLIGGGASFAVGLVMAIVGAIIAPPAEAKADISETTTTQAPITTASSAKSADDDKPLVMTAPAFAAEFLKDTKSEAMANKTAELNGIVKSVESDADNTTVEFEIPAVKGKLESVSAWLPAKTTVKEGQRLTVRGTVYIDDSNPTITLMHATIVTPNVPATSAKPAAAPAKVGTAKH